MCKTFGFKCCLFVCSILKMMVKLLSHIVLATLLLFSGTGMTINMHFCQGHLYDLAVNKPARDCCEESLDGNTCRHDHNMTKPHQCDDESIKIESDHNYLSSGFTFDFEDSYSIKHFANEIFGFNSRGAEKSSTSKLFIYKKPPPQEVTLSQIQQFLL